MSQDDRLVVPSGESLAVATSAMTKALRRGREVEALWWARQIEVRFPKYVLRRLTVFACEDVGLADPMSVVVVSAIATAYRADLVESRAFRPDKNLLAFAVLHLARAPKSREADDLVNTLDHLRDDEGWRPEVPEAALDFHTPEGRTGDPVEQLRHWLTEGRKVLDDAGPLDWRLWIDRRMARHGVLDRDEVEAQARRWDQEGRLRYGLTGYPAEAD